LETVNSMIKPNRGSALRGKIAGGRERDMRLKVLTLGGVCQIELRQGRKKVLSRRSQYELTRW
jgi:hypothetical protein